MGFEQRVNVMAPCHICVCSLAWLVAVACGAKSLCLKIDNTESCCGAVVQLQKTIFFMDQKTLQMMAVLCQQVVFA